MYLGDHEECETCGKKLPTFTQEMAYSEAKWLVPVFGVVCIFLLWFIGYVAMHDPDMANRWLVGGGFLLNAVLSGAVSIQRSFDIKRYRAKYGKKPERFSDHILRCWPDSRGQLGTPGHLGPNRFYSSRRM